jgi:two-component sensor histidine kinase/FixJ family two-component response regulator
VMIATEGEKALQRVKLTRPDLILMDVLMPVMGGFEACRRLKAAETTRDVPVLFMTALADTRSKVDGFQAGGVDYITKPIEIEEVLARVDTHLSLKRIRDRLAKQNRQLQAEVAARKRAEKEVRTINAELEQRVLNRTAELSRANRHLELEIAEHRQTEKELKASLKEKEVLLKEVHHRVKNNLQVVSSLLKLQAADPGDQPVEEMFLESCNRIRAMALVHERLYKSGDLADIDLAAYVEELVATLTDAYGKHAQRVSTRVSGGGIFLNITCAIPCGLVINELVTNALKHAFPSQENGEITIVVGTTGKNEIELIVADNGAGLPDGIDLCGGKTMGLSLVTMLVEDQLEGTLELDRTGGTRYRIVFGIDDSKQSRLKTEG